MKINIDCGQEYLEGYFNIDALGDKTPIGGPKDQPRCDGYKLPCNGEAELVRMVRVFERVKEGDTLSVLLADIEQSLKPGGIFNLLVGKHDMVQKMIYLPGMDRSIFFGPLDYKYPWYIFGYSLDRIMEIVTEHGFEFVGNGNDSFKSYPVYDLVFRKPYELSPRDYIKFPDVPEGSQVLDIGPGRYPIKFATHYMDITDVHFKNMSEADYPGKKIVASITRIPTEFKDKQFDFVFASHILEHIECPDIAAAEISRIGKSGIVVCPGQYKEFLFGYEESEHLWDIYLDGDTMVFRHRDPKFVEMFLDKDFQSIQATRFRSGRFDTREHRYLRNWYRRHEHGLDVVLRWEGSIKVRVE